jgi:hypothetical protein
MDCAGLARRVERALDCVADQAAQCGAGARRSEDHGRQPERSADHKAEQKTTHISSSI